MRHVAGFLCAFLLLVPTARAEMSGGKVKIGVLTDLSGPYEAGAGARRSRSRQDRCRRIRLQNQRCAD